MLLSAALVFSFKLDIPVFQVSARTPSCTNSLPLDKLASNDTAGHVHVRLAYCSRPPVFFTMEVAGSTASIGQSQGGVLLVDGRRRESKLL